MVVLPCGDVGGGGDGAGDPGRHPLMAVTRHSRSRVEEDIQGRLSTYRMFFPSREHHAAGRYGLGRPGGCSLDPCAAFSRLVSSSWGRAETGEERTGLERARAGSGRRRQESGSAQQVSR